MLTVYGIPNCNTVKKALDWLKAHQLEYVFHDYKKQGISKAQLDKWSKQVNWESLLNKRGTTWRTFTEAQQAEATKKAGAFALMTEKPSVIKRPLIERNGTVLTLGFDEQEFAEKIKG